MSVVDNVVKTCVARLKSESNFDPITSTTRVVRIARRHNQVVQDCDVYIGRQCTMGGWNLPRSKWANPFPVQDGDVASSIQKFALYLQETEELWRAIPELRGKVLGCWCKRRPSDPCHGDVLAALANQL